MNRVDDKLYATGQKFADRMNNLLLKMRHELKTVGKKEPVPLKDNTAVVVGALVTGLIIGSVFSLLFAPDAGKNTRDKITKSLKDVKDKNARQQSTNIENVKVGGESALERAKKSTKEMQ